MNLQLFQLHLRRALHPGLGLLIVATWVFVVATRRGASALGDGAASTDALLRGLLRADLTFVLLTVSVPLLLAGVAGSFGRLDSQDRHWLLPRRVSLSSIVLSSWAGSWVGALVWLGLIGVSCEFVAAGGARSLQQDRVLRMEEIGRLGAGGDLGWRTHKSAWPEGSVARFSTSLLGNYGEIERLELSSHVLPNGPAFATATAEPGLRTMVEVSVPEGDGHVWFQFRAEGVTRALMLRDTELRLFVPASERTGLVQFLSRVALVLAGVYALALGLGAWLGPASLLLLLGGSYGLLWIEAESLVGTWLETWVPGFDLPQALELLSQGRAPVPLPTRSCLGAGVLVLTGLCLQRVALGRWRSGP